ncbi:FAD-dependent monooxygenase [Amycolatopsis pithecellobii]|uniref:FAD-binding domain-containing protein n=1 Tax=Amycolatopsis pithecellobii TaxID=664692 RepID=A0A6N7Z8H6_9PSEU|nr:FAD-dependent monooxygenase [Amycolatopsis pithecellobii]MTD58014.1 hypothetical protein [Amycolatopsis pithecellobii]
MPESLYFEYPHYAARRAPELDGHASATSVVVVGAGPVGMALALGLAQRDVPVVVIEPLTTVGYGSRAGSVSRHSIEFLRRLGIADELLDIGLTYSEGWTYFRADEVFHLEIPGDSYDRLPPMLKVQQCYIEAALAAALDKHPLVDLRWGTTLTSLAQIDDTIVIDLSSEDGDYQLSADYVVACDGARSTVRSVLGLELEGVTYPSAFIIADIQFVKESPAGRRVWFDPPWNPGGSVIMHRQPRDIWRFDYQLPRGCSLAEENDRAVITTRIKDHLQWIGFDGDWKLDWTSVYYAHGRRLSNFRHDRLLFAGDAAHLVPIFGVRGLNGGLADVANLAWKLARVVQGRSSDELLDSYATEAQGMADYNIAQADRSTRFMCPRSDGARTLRDAALRLALSNEFVRPLLNPRQSSAVPQYDSPLNATPQAIGCLGAGDVIPDLPLGPPDATPQFVHDYLGDGFTLLHFDDGSADAEVANAEIGSEQVRVARLPVLPTTPAYDRLKPLSGRHFLVRPDTYIVAAWDYPPINDLPEAIRHATATPNHSHD